MAPCDATVTSNITTSSWIHPNRPHHDAWFHVESIYQVGIDYIIKIKIHSSCEIEYVVETHLCKLCDIYIYLHSTRRALHYYKKRCLLHAPLTQHECLLYIQLNIYYL